MADERTLGVACRLRMGCRARRGMESSVWCGRLGAVGLVFWLPDAGVAGDDSVEVASSEVGRSDGVVVAFESL